MSIKKYKIDIDSTDIFMSAVLISCAWGKISWLWFWWLVLMIIVTGWNKKGENK